MNREIEQITTTDPYSYKFFLEDPEMVVAKKIELKSELYEYQHFAESLKNVLQEVLNKSGV